MDGFKSGLRDLGWVEDEGIRFELRAAEGQLHLLPKFASEMVSLGVDLIAVIGAVTVRAVRQATSTIPIVFAVVVEPIGDGLATNLEHPGGNVTGVTTFDPQQATTQLQFLRAVNPGLRYPERSRRFRLHVEFEPGSDACFAAPPASDSRRGTHSGI
jgi:putative tryptophan/tyrosine transport system substrate-binding protein